MEVISRCIYLNWCVSFSSSKEETFFSDNDFFSPLIATGNICGYNVRTVHIES